ncbi:MAG: SusC/RagA family TonB-linked outer membrane protein [Tannerellaceae bacterium]|nr:SusC/RagA family TonB-linked outer membrane protein [Tannerellaceae bacterium]
MKSLKCMLLFLWMSIGLVSGQTTHVTGTVVTAEGGEPVIGATILVSGTSTGTITDYNGSFTLNVPATAEKIEVAYLGMITQTVAVQPTVRVVLEADTKTLDEVIVVAYGTSTKKSFTGSASVVKADAIKQIQSSTVTSALEGRAAGVQIVSSTGQPGENPTVRIRGIGSVNASKAPLYIVDGSTYDGPISALNSSDIESMTVLKDAAANSLYGARGANGVILITTKRNNKSKVGITFDAKWGINSRAVPEYDLVTDPGTYYELAWTGQYNKLTAAGQTHSQALEEIRGTGTNSLQNILGGYNNYNVSWADLLDDNGKLNPNAQLLYRDTWDDALFSNGLRQEYNLSIGNSDEKQSYYIGLGYLGDESYAKGSDFDRYTGRIRVEKQLTNWLKAGANISYAHSIQNFPTTSGGNYINYFQWSRMIGPIYPVFLHDPTTGAIVKDSNGNDIYDYGSDTQYGYARPYGANGNPAGVLEYDFTCITQDNITANAFVDIDLYDGLSVRGAFDVNTSYKNNSKLTNPLYGDAAANNGYVYKTNEKWFSYTGSVFLNYNKNFGDLNVDALAGTESYKKEYEYLYGFKKELAHSTTADFNNAAVIGQLDSYTQKYSVTGILARVNLSYADKYYLTGSYRRDGSSRFHPDNRWGNFGSLGASWRINQEDFLSSATFIDDLRLKASIGTQGNDNLLYSLTSTTEYQNYIPYLDQYLVSNIDDKVSVAQTYLWNKEISWEKA